MNIECTLATLGFFHYGISMVKRSRSRSVTRGRSSVRRHSLPPPYSSKKKRTRSVKRLRSASASALRFGSRLVRSMSRTSTRTETNTDNDNLHGGISRYHIKINFGRPGSVLKHMKKKEKFKIRDNGQCRVTSSEGFQGQQDLLIAPIQNFMPNGAAALSIDLMATYGYLATSLPRLNPNQFLTGGGYVSNTYVPSLDHIFWKRLFISFL